MRQAGSSPKQSLAKAPRSPRETRLLARTRRSSQSVRSSEELETWKPASSLDRIAAVGPERPVATRAEMSIPRTVAEVLGEDATLEVEGIDRTYLKCIRASVELAVQVTTDLLRG